MFPGITLRTPNNISYVHTRDQLKSPQELGYIVSRPKHTRSRKIFTITWADEKVLQTSELSNLLGFYDTYLGSSFTFTDIDSSTYTVIFSDSIKYSEVRMSSGLYQVEVTVEEV